MKKIKKIYYITIILFGLSLLSPKIDFDPDIDYNRMIKKYPKIQKSWYQTLYYNCTIKHVSIDKICALIHSESNWNPKAVSCASARGLGQIMPFWAKTYGLTVKDLFNPHYNIMITVDIWAKYKKMAKGKIKRTIISYNAGAGTPASRYKNWAYLNRIIKDSLYTSNMPVKLIIK